jgi:hypothetical protein
MGHIMAKLCKGGVKLRDQIDRRWPKRDKRSDGWIGDKAHANRTSDHNPNKAGVVHAIDIDENMGKGSARNGRTARRLANQLLDYAASGLPGSNRLKYVVYENRIASGTYRKTWWTWRHGNWGHEAHIHVSFTAAADRDGSVFPLPILARSPIVKARWTRELAKARKARK